MVINQKMSENEMEYRGSKTVSGLNRYKSVTVKEQRVYGSWHSKCLRYTLKGFKRNYQIKIPSNQIKELKYYSTYSNKINSLNPYFLTGISDAEASFIVLVLRDKKNKTG